MNHSDNILRSNRDDSTIVFSFKLFTLMAYPVGAFVNRKTDLSCIDYGNKG
jgi:hypothetical protein